MELTQMRYFLTVAETQHITRSAAQLHIAQPALTQSIHKLEESLGVRLFAAKGRNIVLTPCGRYLQKQLTPLLRQLDELPQHLQLIDEQESRTVRLNVLSASTLVTQAIIAYQSERRDLNFRFLQNAPEELCDIEIRTEHVYTPERRRSGARFVCTEKILLAVPNRAPYTGLRSIRMAEVADAGFICLLASKQFRAICDKFCRHIGFTPKIAFESDSPAAVRNMIAANMGVGFWPEFTWGHIDSDRVRLLEIEDAFCHRDLIVTCSAPPERQAVHAFFEFLHVFCDTQREAMRQGREAQQGAYPCKIPT